MKRADSTDTMHGTWAAWRYCKTWARSPSSSSEREKGSRCMLNNVCSDSVLGNQRNIKVQIGSVVLGMKHEARHSLCG